MGRSPTNTPRIIRFEGAHTQKWADAIALGLSVVVRFYLAFVLHSSYIFNQKKPDARTRREYVLRIYAKRA